MIAALTVADVAEMAKLELNTAPSGTFGQSFTAKRTYVPAADLVAAGKTLSVLVFAKDDDLTRQASRSQVDDELSIDIAVIKRVVGDPTSEAFNVEGDALSKLPKQIALYFKPGNQMGSGATAVRVLRTRIPLPYDSEGLRSKKLFLSIITITFKALVTPGT